MVRYLAEYGRMLPRQPPAAAPIPGNVFTAIFEKCHTADLPYGVLTMFLARLSE